MGGVTPAWLGQLAPDHAPPPPGWWPPAPGWWGLLALAVLAAVLVVWRWRHPERRLQRRALRELRRIATLDDVLLAGELERLLRRYAVARFGRPAVAGLSGRDWMDFVVAHGGAGLAGEPGQALLRAAYGGGGTVLRQVWLDAGRGFLGGR
jgi:hypothetical protein